MKNELLHTVMVNRRTRLTGLMKKELIASFLFLSLSPIFGYTQSVGSWTFNNTLAGISSSSNTVSAASLGSSITHGDYNASTVYYGEGGWPAGALDANAYLQFSLTPNSGKKLTLSAMSLNIRRSTTGTSAGSGPNNWALRSSRDNYTSDIATGTLTMDASSAVNVSLLSGFSNITSTITFRLYGYNATVSTGGLNRFVYDNITVSGASILPVVVEDFNAVKVNDDAVQLAWTLSADEPSTVQLERSNNAVDFTVIKNVITDQNGTEQKYSVVDQPDFSGNADFYYRLKLTTNSGAISYSSVQKVSFSGSNNFSVIALPAHAGGNIQVKVQTDKTDHYQFSMYNMNGSRVAAKIMNCSAGSQLMTMDSAPLMPGVYVLVAERTGRKISCKVLVQ